MPLLLPLKSLAFPAALILGFGLLMCALALFLPIDSANMLYSEEGFFEQASPYVWLAAGCCAFFAFRTQKIKALLIALGFFAYCLARSRSAQSLHQ